MGDPVAKRRWFRFNLRTLFLVLTVFACWLGYHVHWIRQRDQARAWIVAHPMPEPRGSLDLWEHVGSVLAAMQGIAAELDLDGRLAAPP